ncbi:uncharacterized protein FOBCDRAFT_208926 [Fusarium oxysporum Fo47]|uniref:uncharacterized protein n=1 Tax=Fusarium oxysporum Fo47 TaxID=660027 RepID=UPI002869C906|nr:uncharacterized protein FOBCDRAFT_208926 [Fusarium oxysporum Fo47]WJG37212.1 hypothetical protein FOBCDRAFT_208926 [Fusarium oxysporum Fo47]
MATFSDKIHNPDKRQKPHLKNNPEITAVPDSSLIKDITNIIRRDGEALSSRISSRLRKPALTTRSGFAGKSPTFAQKGINYLAYHEAAKLLLKEESWLQLPLDDAAISRVCSWH